MFSWCLLWNQNYLKLAIWVLWKIHLFKLILIVFIPSTLTYEPIRKRILFVNKISQKELSNTSFFKLFWKKQSIEDGNFSRSFSLATSVPITKLNCRLLMREAATEELGGQIGSCYPVFPSFCLTFLFGVPNCRL